MKKLILFFVLTIISFSVATAQKRQIETAKKPVVISEPEMKKYVMVFLKMNENANISEEQSLEIEKLHKEFLIRLNEEGFILMQGNINDEGTIKEVLLVRTIELEEAKVRFDEDPAIKMGKYKIEFHQFLTKNNTITLD